MEIYDARFKSSSVITVAGPSQSGKSTLVQNIVENRNDMFTEPISTVLWYCAYPPSKKLPGVVYKTGLPQFNMIQPHSLVVIDDFMQELRNSNELTSLMTKTVHHLPMSLIFITQNIFAKGSDNKTRRINTNYLIIFKNPHDKAQVEYIGRQMYPRDKNFLVSAFDAATNKSPYSYLLIDCHQETCDEIRVRTLITKNDDYIKVYVPHSINLTA